MIFQKFAELASYLEFEFPDIIILREHPHPSTTTQSRSLKHLLIKNGPSKLKKSRYGLLSKKAYKKNYIFLNLYNIYKKEKVSKRITSFFV